MNWGPALANSVWLATALPNARRFDIALGEPALAQERLLRAMLKRDAPSSFGERHGFSRMRGYADFVRQVPLTSYVEMGAWIDRIRAGEPAVLTASPVTHLAPTSGTSGARKLIPFTAELQRAFARSVGAWWCDLVRMRRGLIGGPGYWAVSPRIEDGAGDASTSAVRIGYEDDAEYLGKWSAHLVRLALAAPGWLRHIENVDTWKRLTALCLLRQRELRLISIWHPSYLDILAEAAGSVWSELCDAIESGEDPWTGKLRAPPARTRARELRDVGPLAVQRWWPRLQVISCWGEQAAEAGWLDLRRRFPGVLVQPKGLLATEAVVTVPWRERLPLAVCSHFFEFIAENGEVSPAERLERGRAYEVVVTNGGGLWRYRLGDRVECVGHVKRTPELRFLGRAGNVSDLRGEKLSEVFVGEVFGHLWTKEDRPKLTELHARLQEGAGPNRAWYELRISGASPSGLRERLENELRRNPHYALARSLGQLEPAQVVSVNEGFPACAGSEGSGIADTKPRLLVRAKPRV